MARPSEIHLQKFHELGLAIQSGQGRPCDSLDALRASLVDRVYWDTHEYELLTCPGARAVAYMPGLEIDDAVTAFFGWFEAEDAGAAQTLLAEIDHWAAARGATQVIGPINGTTAANYRFKTSHFDVDALPGEPDNLPIYVDYLTDAGYAVHHGYSSFVGQANDTVSSTVLPNGLSVRSMGADEWAARKEEALDLCQVVFSQNFAFPGLEPQEWDKIHAYFLGALCPLGSQMALNEDRLVGFSLCVPTMIAGKRTLAVKTVGTHPDFRRSGLFNAMGDRIHAAVLSHYEQVAGVLIRDQNASAITTLFRMVPTETRRYALFVKRATGAPS